MATALSDVKSRLRSRSDEGHSRSGNAGVRSGDGTSLLQSLRSNAYGSSLGRVNGEAIEPNKVQKEITEALSSHGSALWNRVSSTASKLSINVSQAWHKSILAEDGEGTVFMGEDSRLTKAMKAYHLSRVRTPAELPPWLFTERERGVGGAPWKKTFSETSYEDRFRPDAERSYRPATGKGLREVYDSINLTNKAGSAPLSSSTSTGNSQAIDRLRAIRQANRAAGQPQQSNLDKRVAPPANKGLPSGPKEPRSIRG